MNKESNTCPECGAPRSEKATYCSNKCKTRASRKRGVVAGVKSVPPPKPEVFQLTTVIGPLDKERDLVDQKSKIREAAYWYDVPLAAVPILKEGWPKVPDFMNGRQYFLWWKNDFKTNDKHEPIILNPFKEKK